MSDIPVARNTHTSYENFVAECPCCGKENIFNRASDLKTFESIGGLNVLCQSNNCQKTFRIVGDSVNCSHEMLVFDCQELIDRKHYMNCILILAQAYEIFFSLYLRVELLYKPFAADSNNDVIELNRLLNALQDKIKDHTFARMRALFLQHIIGYHFPKNLVEAEALIKKLPDCPGDPKDAAIEGISNVKLVPLLKALKATNINTLRNRVVHKQAYRPTREEVVSALTEARSILFPLNAHLQLHDDINWYMRKP